MKLLLDFRGDEVNITEEVIEVATGNTECGKEIIMLLLDKNGNDVQIMEEVIKAAAENEKSGKEIIGLLIERGGDDLPITEALVKAMTKNSRNGKEIMALLLERRENKAHDSSISDISDEPRAVLKLSHEIHTKTLALLSSIRLAEKGIPLGYRRIWWKNVSVSITITIKIF